MAVARAETSLAERIENDVYLGVLAPGMWLKQIELERRYGCSRISLRQALETVTAKGVLCHEPNRGFHVDAFEDAKIAQITNTRAILEVAAAEQALACVTPALLDAMETLAEAFRQDIQHAPVVKQEAANYRFHEKMLSVCPNRVMVNLIFDLRRRLPIAATRSSNTPARLAQSADDHFQIVAAMRERNLSALKTLMWNHVAVGAVRGTS